jgi:hypothetical protein
MALTDTEARKAKPSAKPYKLADSAGLYLAVMPTRGKLWRWKYRFNGKEKLMALGSYPDVSLAEARGRHADARRLLAGGVDPMARRKAARTATLQQGGTTFEAIATLWIKHWKEDKSPRHVAGTQSRLKKNILPSLGAIQIAEIQAPDVVSMVRAVEARGVRDVAKRALETTGQIFRYAVAHGHAIRNPAAEIKPRDVLKPSQKANYARVDAKDLPGLLRKIEVYQGTHVRILPVLQIAVQHLQHGLSFGQPLRTKVDLLQSKLLFGKVDISRHRSNCVVIAPIWQAIRCDNFGLLLATTVLPLMNRRVPQLHSNCTASLERDNLKWNDQRRLHKSSGVRRSAGEHIHYANLIRARRRSGLHVLWCSESSATRNDRA